MVRRDPPRWNGEQNHPAMQQSSLSQNFASLGLDDDSSEAAVQRWLTSPAATTRSAPKKFHRSNSSPVGPLGTGVETRTAVSSPRAATRGSRLLKERLRQRRVTVKQQMEPKGNDPSQSDDRMDFLFHQPWKKETSTTSTRSTAPFSFSEAGSFESPTSASEASLQTPPPIKNNWEEASNSSFNGGTHGRRSVRSLSIEAVSPRSSVVPPPSPPPQGARMNAKGTPSGSPIGVQTPPRRVGRASVRHQPLAGDSIVGDSSPTTQERRTKGFFGSRDRRNSSSSNSTNCNSPESRASAKLKTEKNEGLISKDYIVNKMMAKQRQDSDEEREKQDSRVKRTMQPLQQRQPLNPPSKMNWIKLHVYDLITDEAIMQLPWGCHFPIGQCFNAVNSGLHTLGTGAYHVGIEINGVEYAYGANNVAGMTGVFTCMPKHSPGYQYRTSIDFGERFLMRKVNVSKKGDEVNLGSERHVDGREIIREMAGQYMGTDYDLLRKNCCIFAHDATIRLGIKEEEVPNWFRNLCDAGAVTQDAAVSTIEPLTRVFSACDMEGAFEDYLSDGGNGFEVIAGGQQGGAEQIVNTASSKS